MLLLVPADPLRPRRPDKHFAAEADAAREAGHQVALVGDDGRVARVPDHEVAVYRGWMLNRAQYATLAGCGVRLRTSPGHYQRGHELPGWYAALAEFTPLSVWTTGFERAGFDAARRELGPGPPCSATTASR